MRTTHAIRGALIAGALLLTAAHTVPATAGVHPRVFPFFGASLDNESQPSNAAQGLPCSDSHGIPHGAVCTWVAVEAFHNGGHEAAPMAGTIRNLRLISCVPGSFRLQIARAVERTRQARIVRNGPVINYKGDPRGVNNCGGIDGTDFRIQTFSVNVHVNKGDFMAIQTAKTGVLSCSGGSGALLYAPPLQPGGPLRTAKSTASCDLLVQLVYGGIGD